MPPQQWQGGPGQPHPQWRPGPGQPGPGGGAAKKNTGKIVAIVAAGAVVLAGAGVGIAAAAGAFSRSPEQQVRDAFDTFFKASAGGDVQKAFDMVCAEQQEEIQEYLDAFDTTLEDYLGVDDTAELSVEVTDVSMEDDDQAAVVTFDTTLVWEDGDEQTYSDISGSWIKEDGAWKSCDA